MYKIQGDSILRISDGALIGASEGNKDYRQFIQDVANGATVEGETVTEPDYVALRTGPEGYAPAGDQLDMQYKNDGSWEAHVADVKDRFPKTITGGESIAPVPDWVQEKADAWLFNDQLTKYKAAVERLAQHILADGRAEITEMQPTGEQTFNEETGEMEDVMHEVIVQTAIEPVEPTVERTVYGDDPDAEPTVEVIENPLITQDNLERAEAQAVVDATPQEVKDAIP